MPSCCTTPCSRAALPCLFGEQQRVRDVNRVCIEVDHTAQSVYVDLGGSERGISTTVEAMPRVNVDLNSYGIAVGVEVLTLSLRDIPLEELMARYHFRRKDQELVRKLPDIIDLIASST